MTLCSVPISPQGSVLTGGFVRYRGDDWDGANLLLFQYGTLVSGAVNPIDITGCQPVGSLLVRARWVGFGSGQIPSPPSLALFSLTVAAGTARIVDPKNGLFGFCPRSDITSQLPYLPDAATIQDATLQIAAKLIDTATPGNLGTIAKSPVLVYGA